MKISFKQYKQLYDVANNLPNDVLSGFPPDTTPEEAGKRYIKILLYIINNISPKLEDNKCIKIAGNRTNLFLKEGYRALGVKIGNSTGGIATWNLIYYSIDKTPNSYDRHKVNILKLVRGE